MSQDDQETTVVVNIDGQEVAVPAGTNIIEVAAQLGIEIPHYCYHSQLSVAGNCRMCLVEIGTPLRDRTTGEPVVGREGKQKIGWQPKPAIACATNATPGLHVKTTSKLVQDCQQGVMEFLLVNHPLDCPICDQAGECLLQEFATDYGRGYSRFVEAKNVKPKRTRLGPRITLDDERCILCSRCIRFCNEIIHEDILGFVDRGSYTTLTCYPGREFDSNYSLNTVDICPVGALTSTDFRFKMRVWFLQKVPSICAESSVGVNTDVWHREGVIYRITPRQNDAVNNCWMADSGRELYKQVEADNRLTQFMRNGSPVSLGEAFEQVGDFLSVAGIAIVVSGRLAVEEQFLLKQLAKHKNAQVYCVAKTAPGDGFLISTDRSPNVRGGLLTGLISDLPTDTLDELKQQVQSGAIKTIIAYGEDLLQYGFTESQLRKVCLVYFGTHGNGTSHLARVVVPTLTVFEKSGTFVNQQFRLQKFKQVIPGPPGLLPDIYILNQMMNVVASRAESNPSLDEIWQLMTTSIPQFKDVTYSNIAESGVLLDSSAFKHLSFCEQAGLHYDPEVTTVGN